MIFALSLMVAQSSAPSSAQSSAPSGLTLQIEVTKLRSDNGGVLVGLYDAAEGYPGKPDKAVRKGFATIKDHIAHLEFSGLPAGEYAIAVIHDENGNRKLDTNFLGIPKEGVGASNNAKGFMGPPKYKDAKFELKSDGQKAIVPMQYL